MIPASQDTGVLPTPEYERAAWSEVARQPCAHAPWAQCARNRPNRMSGTSGAADKTRDALVERHARRTIELEVSLACSWDRQFHAAERETRRPRSVLQEAQ